MLSKTLDPKLLSTRFDSMKCGSAQFTDFAWKQLFAIARDEKGSICASLANNRLQVSGLIVVKFSEFATVAIVCLELRMPFNCIETDLRLKRDVWVHSSAIMLKWRLLSSRALHLRIELSDATTVTIAVHWSTALILTDE